MLWLHEIWSRQFAIKADSVWGSDFATACYKILAGDADSASRCVADRASNFATGGGKIAEDPEFASSSTVVENGSNFATARGKIG